MQEAHFEQDTNAMMMPGAIAGLQRVNNWLVDGGEIFFATLRLCEVADTVPDLAALLACRSVEIERKAEGEHTIATIKVGGEAVILTAWRWDMDGVPNVWPWTWRK